MREQITKGLIRPNNEFSAARDTPSAAEIRGELSRVLQSAAFRNAPQLSLFLSFVVENTLAGCSDRIKSYTIGIDALGRAANFDPQTDPIVRVAAGRLRRALADYYAGAGSVDSVVITVPRGSYVPQFRWRGPEPITGGLTAGSRKRLTDLHRYVRVALMKLSGAWHRLSVPPQS